MLKLVKNINKNILNIQKKRFNHINLDNKNKLQYISDLHLEYRKKVPLIPSKGNYLALCGDIGSPFDEKYRQFIRNCSNSYEKVFIISGNHEYWNKQKINMDIIDETIKYVICELKNVFFLSGQTEEITPNTIITGATLWSQRNNIHLPKRRPHNINGDLGNIYIDDMLIDNKIINKIHLRHKLALENSIEDANCNNKNLIVLTHHLPSHELIIKKYRNGRYDSTRYASHLDHLIKKPIQAWLCGHSHCIYSKVINDVYCGINAVGPSFNNFN